jgi:hypothetical protein
MLCSLHPQLRSASALLAKKEPIPENETESEQTERLKRRAKRMMFNENGVAYAPWMNKQIDEDVGAPQTDLARAVY